MKITRSGVPSPVVILSSFLLCVTGGLRAQPDLDARTGLLLAPLTAKEISGLYELGLTGF
jgi:hypothetical protein